MGTHLDPIRTKIRRFKRRYYVHAAVRGVLISTTILCGYFLIAALLENGFWLNTLSRLTLLTLFLITLLVCFAVFLKNPFWFWLSRKGMNDEQSARLLGKRIPQIKDRLLNLIQLGRSQSPLAEASVKQRAGELSPLSFDDAVHMAENKKYLRYLGIPLALVAAILLINASVITESTNRIIHFRTAFSPKAPFSFIVINEALRAFRNEDFTLRLRLEGSAIPDQAYVVTGTRRLKMEDNQNGEFTYTFDNLQESLPFQIEAAGFYSSPNTIAVANRPELVSFNVDLNYPAYLQRKSEQVTNTGTLQVPEGTVVTWNIKTAFTRDAAILFSGDEAFPMESTDDQTFTYSKRFLSPGSYQITLQNPESRNKDRIAYTIDVIKDAYPEITLNAYNDSAFYKMIGLGGFISDDHGLTALVLHFDVFDDHGAQKAGGKQSLPIAPNQGEQSFFYPWRLDSITLKPGERLEYFLSVWDNDGVNGHKASRSTTYTLSIPGKDELITNISKAASKTAGKFDRGVNKATELNQQIDEVSKDLKGKKTLDWQDRKKLESILQQQSELDKLLKELTNENKILNEKKDAFTEQDERIKEKAEQIRKLMDELFDEETRKMFDELEKLLREKTDLSQMKDLLEKLNQNSSNLEKELERTLELFKQIQYEFKVDQAIRELAEKIKEQKEIQAETKEAGEEAKDRKKLPEGAGQRTQDLAKKQQELNESFKGTEERLEELRDLAEQLKQNDPVPSDEDVQETEQSMQQSQEMLEENEPSKAGESQQKSLQQMQSMQQQMQQMMSSSMMEIDMQNVEKLRQILHGLIKLSFDQEGLLDEFQNLQQNDPRFNKLALEQIGLRDDAKVLEDSLIALGKRDPFMGSFISREVTTLNGHLDKAIDAYHSRTRPQAQGEMQASMTSINDLALMLDDHYDMLMTMMANARPSGKKQGQGKAPSLGKLQEQLNQRIEELKNSGKSGRELSEELARMAAEQERIRRALQELQKNSNQNNQGQLPGSDLPSKMEDTELDLVNKQLTDELIKRQHQILTRLLEAEKSLREQEVDDERQGETAKDYEKEIPQALEDYLQSKEKEIELIKTMPPKLYPFYKDEVNKYFKRITQ